MANEKDSPQSEVTEIEIANIIAKIDFEINMGNDDLEWDKACRLS